jgi:enamine deaminase RidA (YjgF/YER057c/UK114 family)
MHVRTLYHFGRRFVSISAEAAPDLDSQYAYTEVMHRCAAQLEAKGLGLDDTVRTRLWARTRDDRDAASLQRRALAGNGPRPASSSYIAPDHFLTQANVAVELLAMEPRERGAERYHEEYDPPITPARYLAYDGMLFLSGVSAAGATLEDAILESLTSIHGSLKLAGLTWKSAISVSAYVRRDVDLAETRDLILQTAPLAHLPMLLASVEGFSSPPKLLEIEVTAAGLD